MSFTKSIILPHASHVHVLLNKSGFLKKDVRLTQKKETLRIKFTTKNAKKIQRHIAAIQQKIKIYEKMRTFL